MRNLSILSDTNATGLGHVFGIDGAANALCYLIEVFNLQPVAVGNGKSAHIHERSSGR